MSFCLVVSKKIKFPVTGQITGEDGQPVPFSFKLVAERSDSDAFKDGEGNPATIGSLLKAKVSGWEDVYLGDTSPAPFSPEAFDGLLKLINMPAMVFAAYMDACGARGKEKN